MGPQNGCLIDITHVYTCEVITGQAVRGEQALVLPESDGAPDHLGQPADERDHQAWPGQWRAVDPLTSKVAIDLLVNEESGGDGTRGRTQRRQRQPRPTHCFRFGWVTLSYIPTNEQRGRI